MKRKVLALVCALTLGATLLGGCGSAPAAAQPETQAAADAADAQEDGANTQDGADADTAADAQDDAGEGAQASEEVEAKGTVTVAATPVPHAEILNEAKALMAAKGWTLEVTEFTDYVQPNEVVESGEIDANYFQHINYLNSYNEEKGTHLVNAGEIHYEPMGIYPGKESDLAAISEGAEIAVPNDTTNEARALLLLHEQGLIELDPEAGITATVLDITANPSNIKIVELAAEQVARTLPDVAFGVVNGNYALQAGLSTADAVAQETESSEAIQQYVNVIAVKEGNENNEGIKALVEVLKSDEIKKFIEENYQGSVVPYEG